MQITYVECSDNHEDREVGQRDKSHLPTVVEGDDKRGNHEGHDLQQRGESSTRNVLKCRDVRSEATRESARLVIGVIEPANLLVR